MTDNDSRPAQAALQPGVPGFGEVLSSRQAPAHPDRNAAEKPAAEAEEKERLQALAAEGLAAPLGEKGELRLTGKGVAWLETMSRLQGPHREVPHYREDQRALYWRGERVLVYERKAPNQMALLLAFQRHQPPWPSCVENPFGTGPEGRVRLEQTLKDLNRRLRRHGLCFHVHSEGRVCWKSSTGENE